MLSLDNWKIREIKLSHEDVENSDDSFFKLYLFASAVWPDKYTKNF